MKIWFDARAETKTTWEFYSHNKYEKTCSPMVSFWIIIIGGIKERQFNNWMLLYKTLCTTKATFRVPHHLNKGMSFWTREISPLWCKLISRKRLNGAFGHHNDEQFTILEYPNLQAQQIYDTFRLASWLIYEGGDLIELCVAIEMLNIKASNHILERDFDQVARCYHMHSPPKNNFSFSFYYMKKLSKGLGLQVAWLLTWNFKVASMHILWPL